MDAYTATAIANQRIVHTRRNPQFPNAPYQIEVVSEDHKVSWERHGGKGYATTRVGASLGPKDGAPWISFEIEECKLANLNHDTKRDVAKRVFTTLHGDAALELYEMLKTVFEPVVPGGG